MITLNKCPIWLLVFLFSEREASLHLQANWRVGLHLWSFPDSFLIIVWRDRNMRVLAHFVTPCPPRPPRPSSMPQPSLPSRNAKFASLPQGAPICPKYQPDVTLNFQLTSLWSINLTSVQTFNLTSLWTFKLTWVWPCLVTSQIATQSPSLEPQSAPDNLKPKP